VDRRLEYLGGHVSNYYAYWADTVLLDYFEEVPRIDTGSSRLAKLASCTRTLRTHLVASEKTLQSVAPFRRSVATLGSLPIVVKVRRLWNKVQEVGLSPYRPSE